MAKAYAFFGDSYSRYDVDNDAVDSGYPKPISSGWSGLAELDFATGIDTVLDLGSAKAYLFKGDSYVRVDQAANSLDEGYPLFIADQWSGFADAGFEADIDASANWGDDTVYFFKGDQVLRYRISTDSIEAGYPQLIADRFPGLAGTGFEDGIQAAVMWPSGNAYFFKDDSYIKLGADGVASEVNTIVDNWPGLAGPIDAFWVRLDSSPVTTGALKPGDHVWYWNGNVSQTLDIPRQDWFGTLPGYEPHNPTDYRGNGTDIYNFVIHADGEIRRGRPHMKNHEGTFGWLNNNPGNLTEIENTRHDYGQYHNKFNWHHFMIFPTMQAGSDAILPFILDRWSTLSINDAMARYAPASDGNDPVSYAADLAAAASVPVSTAFGTLTPEQKQAVQEAIARREGVREGVVLSKESPELPEEIRSML